jgi:tetratricopeptide (TPR) repeat protein
VPDFSPDRPVLYPPSVYAPAPAQGKRVADKSVTFVPIDEDKLKLLEAQKGGDRGNLYGDRGGGDKGRLFEGGSGDKSAAGNGDRGNLDRAGGGDRGNLYDQAGRGGDRGNLHDQAGRGDRGNLMEVEKGDRGNALEVPKKGLNKNYLIGGGTVAVIAVIVGLTGFTVTQQNNSPKVVLARGIASVAKGEYADARAAFAQISGNKDNTAVSKRVQAYALCMTALSYIKTAGENGSKADLTSAEEALKDASDRDPENAEPYYILGRMYEASHQLSKAVGAYEKAASKSAKYSDDLHRVQNLINGT